MISGSITLEDVTVAFHVNDRGNTVTYTVMDTFSHIAETKTVPQDKFFKALAIAIHNDGMPNYELDYPDAESIMGNIRWIP